jgi:Fe-S oxidoreductase/nitrate reductase gamma subunit
LLTTFDLLLIAVAALILSIGLARRLAIIRAGKEEPTAKDLSGLLGYLIGHTRIRQRRYVGIAHHLIFSGFLVTLIIVVLAQIGLTLPLLPARLLSLLTDVLGTAMMLGILFFLVRRMITSEPWAPRRAILPMVLLLGIAVTGFLAEGVRLSLVQSPSSWSSPVGWLFSLALPGSPLLMQLLIRFHFLLVLCFLAVLPFTFMRHLVAASLNVYFRRAGHRGELRTNWLGDGPRGARTAHDFTWKQRLEAEACVSCGRCEENCPAFLADKPLSPRKVMQDIYGQLSAREGCAAAREPLLHETVTADELWSCTTCLACVEHCPVMIEPLDKIVDMRRYQVMDRARVPQEARAMWRNLEIYGDVYGKGIAHRADWAFQRGVFLKGEDLSKDVLLWVGCAGAFHPRYQEVPRALVKILKAARVEFAILGKEELCCGDPARRMGEESLFTDLAHRNAERFASYDVGKIITMCPHCFNTLKNEYPRLGADLEVSHASEFVSRLIEEKRIELRYPVNQSLTVQDPCYLGRANSIYEPLRDIVRGIPGLELKELPRSREHGFCCGGGGGRMWLHEALGSPINRVRADEITRAGVGLVGTACPYCLTMLEDGIKSLEMERSPRPMDLLELVASSLA